MKLIYLKCNGDARKVLIKKLKINFTKLLTHNQYCSLCFTSETELNSLEEEIIVNIWEKNNTVSLRSVLKALFGDEVNQVTSSCKICLECTENTIQAYKFIQNAKISNNVIEEFINSTQGNLEGFEAKDFLDEDEASSMKAESEKQHETKYSCEYCNSTLNTKYTLHKHFKDCPKKVHKETYYCSICKTIECKHEKYLKSLEEQLKDKKTIKCPDCNLVCGVSKPAFLKHVNKVHLNIITNICEICAKPFHSNSAYWNHSRVHHIENYRCQYCEENLENNKTLQEHYAVCAKIKRKFKCEKCPASFNTQLSLLQHDKKHTDKLACKICGKVVRLSSLKIHQRLHQNDVAKSSKFPCSVCNENFLNTSIRAKHMKEHHKTDNKHKSTAEKMTKSHLDSKRHKCPKCDYSTTLGLALDAHINRFHLKIAPYSCKICQKNFTGALKRDEHMKTHSDEKIYQCESCGKHLASKSALKKHIMLHTGMRPYKCDICEMGFTSSSVRNIHKIRSHTEKTIKCPLCDQMFHTLPIMRTHFKKKHWKRQDLPFDVKQVKGLKEEDYELFRDRRMIVI